MITDENQFQQALGRSDLEAHWIQEAIPSMTDKNGEQIDKETNKLR